MAHDDPICSLTTHDNKLYSGSLRSIKVIIIIIIIINVNIILRYGIFLIIISYSRHCLHRTTG